MKTINQLRDEWDDYGRPTVMSVEKFAKEYLAQ